ncbi:MAG TPA: hypothetical protein VE867_03195, partial [Candidatus Binatia bacterium]|nr:hypothetical protein [Candidatus Binatia bacterium]
ARCRRATNRLGQSNKGKRCLLPGFTLNRSDTRRLVGAMASWARIELAEAWYSWWRRSYQITASRPNQAKKIAEQTIVGNAP